MTDEGKANWRYLNAHPLEVTGDMLLLAGDIGYLGDDNYSRHPFWDWASENYEEVHCCMGNRWSSESRSQTCLDYAESRERKAKPTMSSTNTTMWRHCPTAISWRYVPNVFSHYNGIVRIGDTDIILSTLWSRIPLEDAYFTEQVISDFRRILT